MRDMEQRAVVGVRPARPEDAAAIAHVHAAGWQDTYRFMPDAVLAARNEAMRRAQWQAQLGAPGGTEGVFVLTHRARVTGFAWCLANDDADLPATGQMRAMYVLADYRGGVSGPLLFRAMARDLMQRCLAPVGCWAFRGNPIRRWYAQLGWRRVIDRDRILDGFALPETGYVHPDLNGFIDRLERFIDGRAPGLLAKHDLRLPMAS